MATDGNCEAQFVGRAPVSGPITTHYLDSLVSTLVAGSTPKDTSPPPSLDDSRCRLKCGVEGLVVWNPIRKDEGFESDAESQTSADGDKTKGDENSTATEAKKPSGDDTSSANSSGSDSDLEVPLSTPRSSKTQYQVHDFSSVLFCHIPESSPSVVAWVLKSTSTAMECLVFDCLTAAKAVALYQSFDEHSRSLKLDKFRSLKKSTPMSSLSVPKNPDGSTNMKIDGRNICVSVNNVIVEKRRSGVEKPSFAFLTPRRLKEAQQQQQQQASKKGSKPWNLIQHTDENGVTHIEIENGGSSHKSLCDIVLPPSDDVEHSSIISISAPDPPEPYRSLDSVMSMSNWAATDPGVDAGVGTAAGAASGKGAAAAGNKPRQRKPAMLIRAPKSSGGGSEPGSNGTRAVLFRDSNPPGMKQPYNPLQLNRAFQLGFGESSQTAASANEIAEPSVAEFPTPPTAPKPPPRTKTNSSNGAAIFAKPSPPPPPPPPPPPGQTFFVPTKSGAEPRKVLYPKETHVVRGKFVRARVGSGPYEFYPQNFFVAGTFWGTKSPSSSVSAMSAMSSMSTPSFFHGRYSALEMPELGRGSRDSHSLPLEYRRRSRSKSPARRSTAPSMTAAPASLSNWPQRFLRDFSDAMRAKRSGKDKGDDFAERMKSFTRTELGTSAPAPAPPSAGNGFPTKPAIRKSCRSSKSRSSSRRVTFNSYATVRLLDIS